jgi:hypothetical protein
MSRAIKQVTSHVVACARSEPNAAASPFFGPQDDASRLQRSYAFRKWPFLFRNYGSHVVSIAYNDVLAVELRPASASVANCLKFFRFLEAFRKSESALSTDPAARDSNFAA